MSENTIKDMIKPFVFEVIKKYPKLDHATYSLQPVIMQLSYGERKSGKMSASTSITLKETDGWHHITGKINVKNNADFSR